MSMSCGDLPPFRVSIAFLRVTRAAIVSPGQAGADLVKQPLSWPRRNNSRSRRYAPRKARYCPVCRLLAPLT